MYAVVCSHSCTNQYFFKKLKVNRNHLLERADEGEKKERVFGGGEVNRNITSL